MRSSRQRPVDYQEVCNIVKGVQYTPLRGRSLSEPSLVRWENLMVENRNADKISIQMQLNRLHDEWMISVTKGDLEACDRLWQEMDVVYQKLRDHLPITPTG